jgi:hypothetical protein
LLPAPAEMHVHTHFPLPRAFSCAFAPPAELIAIDRSR